MSRYRARVALRGRLDENKSCGAAGNHVKRTTTIIIGGFFLSEQKSPFTLLVSSNRYNMSEGSGRFGEKVARRLFL